MEEKKYTPTIGLEIHAELKTATKMFCCSRNDPDEQRPNVNICPICMGHPGTLPVINKEAIKHVLKVGLALGGKIADFTEFDRKNYFYPDIPKNYQISQYKHPLVSGGVLAGVQITRVHLEEDTASSSHEGDGESYIDFNRAGVPLMELVTEPVIRDSKTAVLFAKELQLLLQYLGVANANMEKGEMRVEANISVSNTSKFGTKVEVKNLNSFKAVERAIEFEIQRQVEAIENGQKVAQETRGWDEVKEMTYSQRSKEESHDYRYFPDPDLPKLKCSEISEFSLENLRKETLELPNEKRERYKTAFEIKSEDVEVYVREVGWGKFFEAVADNLGQDKNLVQLASNYIISDLLGMVRKSGTSNVPETIDNQSFAKLIKMISSKKVSSRGAKDILRLMYEKNGDPEEIATRENLLQKSDEAGLEAIARKVLETNEKVVEDYKKGKIAALQFLVGQCMKESRGSANPEVAREVLKRLIGV